MGGRDEGNLQGREASKVVKGGRERGRKKRGKEATRLRGKQVTSEIVLGETREPGRERREYVTKGGRMGVEES